MREIKFRAYIYDLTDEDSHPLEIDVRAGKLWDVASINFKDRIAEIMDDDGNVWEYELNSNEIALVQYTGVKDKNGKEIYEGDIVKYDDAGGETHTQVIEYDDEMGAFCCDRGAYVDYFTCMWEIEVIGNIYENPGLLKDKR